MAKHLRIWDMESISYVLGEKGYVAFDYVTYEDGSKKYTVFFIKDKNMRKHIIRKYDTREDAFRYYNKKLQEV